MREDSIEKETTEKNLTYTDQHGLLYRWSPVLVTGNFTGTIRYSWTDPLWTQFLRRLMKRAVSGPKFGGKDLRFRLLFLWSFLSMGISLNRQQFKIFVFWTVNGEHCDFVQCIHMTRILRSLLQLVKNQVWDEIKIAVWHIKRDRRQFTKLIDETQLYVIILCIKQ